MFRTCQTALLVLALLALAPGCQPPTSAPGLPAGANNAAPAFDAATLPAPPAGPTGAVRVVSDYSYQFTDELASEGALWAADHLQLGGSGLAYAILGSLAGGQQVRAVALDGTCSGLWLGVSDYGRKAWHWQAGPLNTAGTHNLPPLQMFNLSGEMYIALVCPEGASADVAITLLIDEPESGITLGPDLTGEVIKPLLGVNAGPAPVGEAETVDLSSEYTALGVNYVRTHDFYGPLDLAVMYPDRTADPAVKDSYNFTESDLRWRAIVDCGAQPYFRLGDSYSNPTPPADAAERDNMALAAVNIVHHYYDGLWDGFTTPFEYVEIWNEPDGPVFWPGHTRVEFFQFYAAVAQQLRSAFPELKLGGPGFTVAAYKVDPAGRQYVTDFLRYMQDYNVPLDFLSWHMYSNTPVDYSEAGAWYREQLNTHDFSAAESHVTEYNTALTDIPADDHELRCGPHGAAVLSACWIKLQSAEAAVDLATFYRGNDTALGMPDFFGLYYGDGAPKKIAQAFALWHLLSLCPDLVQAVAVKSGGGASPLWVLAGRSGASQALLVVNPGTAETNYSLAFSDGTFPEQYSISLREVSAAEDGATALPTDGILIPIPADAVQLIELAPLP